MIIEQGSIRCYVKDISLNFDMGEDLCTTVNITVSRCSSGEEVEVDISIDKEFFEDEMTYQEEYKAYAAIHKALEETIEEVEAYEFK